ncbi:shikimate dehydrogenase [Zafaria sp. J156]|uniref:shikimate dehydrogenase n=1 Tax=Zafaria sp. J156 TaxID=3116490 RepID=UPI002E7A6A98|nr:shikimate dehydrogenase [Zafaria sp. J156]MEE1619830.1 shikimate dehydrogenase [Zafaria sp. J156]
MSTTSESFLVGLIGDGVTPSLTPPMHEAEGDAQGLRYLYRPVDLTPLGRDGADVGELLRAGRDLGFNAFNVTHPCKQLVLEHLDTLSDDARRLGAVNTVLIRDGQLHGENTDFSGFAHALRTGLDGAALGTVVQLGAGGAGAAVAYALLASGVEHLRLLDLDADRAEERAAALRALFPGRDVTSGTPDDAAAALATADGLVHCTPVGMHQHPGLPVGAALLDARPWVADIVYRPVETELVLAARAAGCRVLDGGHMAVGQAVDAFRLITGREPDAERMRAHFLSLLEQGL